MFPSRGFSPFPLVVLGVTAVLMSLSGAANAQGSSSAKPNKPRGGSAATKTKKAKPPQIAGGANQVNGLNGKVGDMLFDGRWRFQVQEVTPASSYTLTVPGSEQDYARFHDVADEDLATHVFTPKAGYTFVSVKCLVKNGQNTMQQLDCYAPDLKTALADDQGSSYPPIAYDMQSRGAWTTKPLLPGAQQTLTALFALPTGTKLKDLVFSLRNWSDRKQSNVRIALPPLSPPPPPASTPAAAVP